MASGGVDVINAGLCAHYATDACGGRLEERRESAIDSGPKKPATPIEASHPLRCAIRYRREEARLAFAFHRSPGWRASRGGRARP